MIKFLFVYVSFRKQCYDNGCTFKSKWLITNVYVFDFEDEWHQYIVNVFGSKAVNWSIQHSVVTAITLLIMVLLSPSCPTETLCVSFCECVRVCVWWLLCFSCMLSPWQPNYYFQQYTDIQIENCNLECGSFLTGWWFIRCLYMRFFPVFLFSLFSTMGNYVHWWCHWKWNRRGGFRKESVKFDLWKKKKTIFPPFDFEWTICFFLKEITLGKQVFSII